MANEFDTRKDLVSSQKGYIARLDPAREVSSELTLDTGTTNEMNFETIDGYITIDLREGAASYRERDKTRATEQLNLLKRQYSIEAISTAAKRTGWNRQQLARLNAKRKTNRLTITRR